MGHFYSPVAVNPMGHCVLNNFRLSCTHRCASQVSGGSLAMEEQNPVWAHLLFYSLQKKTT